MNAAHISNAITVMEEAKFFLIDLPYTDSEAFDRKWDAIGKLTVSSETLTRELSRINMEITSTEATGGA